MHMYYSRGVGQDVEKKDGGGDDGLNSASELSSASDELCKDEAISEGSEATHSDAEVGEDLSKEKDIFEVADQPASVAADVGSKGGGKQKVAGGNLPVGLKECEIARSSLSKCWLCGAKISKGQVWVSYRLRETKALRDVSRCHVACVRGIPMATRAVDIATVQGLLDKELCAVVTAALREVRLALQETLPPSGSGAASSSSGPK